MGGIAGFGIISVCLFFTVFTGGSGVTILALGGLLYPALLKEGYRERFSLGLLTASGSLGLLLPPALPLAAGGALGSLLLTGHTLSISSLIGLLMLIGIVTKNSILLVDYAIMARRDLGLPRTEALIDACHKRARPIVMTSVAMIAGMVPLALGFGGDASFRQPMAVTVIGGLITSTGLSLLIVPVAFTYVLGFERWVNRLFTRGRPSVPVEAGAFLPR